MRPLLLIVMLLMLVAPSGAARAAQPVPESEVTFTFANGTLADDEALIRIGIRFAREFFAAEFGVGVAGPIAVDVRGTQQFDVIAHTAPGEIYIATGAMGWHYAPPLRKLQTVIHEYVHLIHWQEDPAGTMPLWLAEGSAEYLAWYAIDRLGLLDLVTARDFWIGSLASNPALAGVPLGALEQPDVNGAASLYEIGAFAVSRLVEISGVPALFEYFPAPSGATRAEAFTQAFGYPIASFYVDFEAIRVSARPNGYDVSRLHFPWYPSPDAAAISSAVAWSEVTRGGLALVQASTSPGVTCTLSFVLPDGQEAFTQQMRANTDGSIFWLWEVGGAVPTGDASAKISCGLNTVIEAIEVEST